MPWWKWIELILWRWEGAWTNWSYLIVDVSHCFTKIEARDVGDECLSTDSTLPPCTWFTHPGIEFTAGRLRSCSHRTLHQLWVREGSFWETTCKTGVLFWFKKAYVRNNPLGPVQKVPEVRVYLRFSNSNDSGFWRFWGDSQAAYDGRFIYFGFGDVTGGILDKVPTVYHGGGPSSKGDVFFFAFSKHFGKAANTQQETLKPTHKVGPYQL